MPKSYDAQIHRFHNAVALHVSTGETIYISPADARRFAKALDDCAIDCCSMDFQESQFVTQPFRFEHCRD